MMQSDMNYMPAFPSPDDLDLSARICADDKIFSDSSGISNRDKWNFAMDVMECDDCSLFSALSFEEIYAQDDPMMCEAAAFIADLRSQYLLRQLDRYPASLESHQFYVRNRQWYSRLRERTSLAALEEISKRVILT
jgi:hypothetical protein